MSNITGARKPLEINEIRLIAMDALTAFLRSRHTYSMNTHELPDMIIKAGFARGKLPRNASDVDGLTERRILFPMRPCSKSISSTSTPDSLNLLAKIGVILG